MKQLLLIGLLASLSFYSYSQTPVVYAKKRTSTISINGNPSESAWTFTNNVTKVTVGTPNNTVKYAVLWDDSYLYVAVTVIDATKVNESTLPHDDDAVEIFIDADNNGGTTYGLNDRQFMKEWNSSALWEKNNKTSGVSHAWANITNGYAIEMRIPWSSIGITAPAAGFTIGFDVAADDDDNNGTRDHQQVWAGDNDNWQYPQNFGDLVLFVSDTQAPSTPTGLVASSIASTGFTLGWTAATDNLGVMGYNVFRNGTKLNTSLITTTSYALTGLAASTTYQMTVQSSDASGNLSAVSTALPVTTIAAAPICSGTGTINFQKFDNITGTTVANLTSNAAYPNSPTTAGAYTTFEMPSNTVDNYGMRLYGFICAPTTGNYRFWIAGDDNVELWLSTTSSATNKVRVAYHTQYTASREWNKYPTQKSASIALIAGQQYYVEALMKEGTQGDNLAVGWAKPGQSTTTPSEVIPGTSLFPFTVTAPDSVAPAAPTALNAANITSTTLSLTWTASTDNIGVAGYDVFRNGTKINTALVNATNFAVTGLTPATTYDFTVQAKDAAGNASPLSAALNITTLAATPGSETFGQRTVIANQNMPHDLVYGPDNNIWYTERFAGTVSFVNPATSVKTVVLTLGSQMVRVGGQDGLMGLALHPQFRTGKPYVYISYTYASSSATVRQTRIARYTYDSVARTLGSAVTILENIPGSNDHNSARLAVGPDLKLYYTVGDMGAGQYDNTSRANHAQNLNILEGKVLRLNTEVAGTSWIPTDNPFTDAGGQKTTVYSLGHRNPQGLVWGNVNGTDRLYSSEHGPFSDDELNIIETGRNYGWPQVAGFCDGNYNGRSIGGFTIVSEQNNCTALNAKEPIGSLFPAATPPNGSTGTMTWPSTAVSGTEFYGVDAIPGWQHSLLVAQLKKGAVARFKLSNDGLSIISDTINYFQGKGRFRDVVVSPDGMKIYVACDSEGATSGPTGGVTSTPPNPGSILEFTYQPVVGFVMSNAGIPREQVLDRSIDVYPNPASNFIVVYNYKSDERRNLELMDMQGKVVRRMVSSGLATRMEVSNLAKGVYMLKVSDLKGKVVRMEKVMIK